MQSVKMILFHDKKKNMQKLEEFQISDVSNHELKLNILPITKIGEFKNKNFSHKNFTAKPVIHVDCKRV